MFTNDRRNFYSPHIFQHSNFNGRKRTQAHTYELHTDERRTHTNVSEFYSGPIRKYMQVDVRGSSSMCEGGLLG